MNKKRDLEQCSRMFKCMFPTNTNDKGQSG